MAGLVQVNNSATSRTIDLDSASKNLMNVNELWQQHLQAQRQFKADDRVAQLQGREDTEYAKKMEKEQAQKAYNKILENTGATVAADINVNSKDRQQAAIDAFNLNAKNNGFNDTNGSAAGLAGIEAVMAAYKDPNALSPINNAISPVMTPSVPRQNINHLMPNTAAPVPESVAKIKQVFNAGDIVNSRGSQMLFAGGKPKTVENTQPVSPPAPVATTAQPENYLTTTNRALQDGKPWDATTALFGGMYKSMGKSMAQALNPILPSNRNVTPMVGVDRTVKAPNKDGSIPGDTRMSQATFAKLPAAKQDEYFAKQINNMQPNDPNRLAMIKYASEHAKAISTPGSKGKAGSASVKSSQSSSVAYNVNTAPEVKAADPDYINKIFSQLDDPQKASRESAKKNLMQMGLAIGLDPKDMTDAIKMTTEANYGTGEVDPRLQAKVNAQFQTYQEQVKSANDMAKTIYEQGQQNARQVSANATTIKGHQISAEATRSAAANKPTLAQLAGAKNVDALREMYKGLDGRIDAALDKAAIAYEAGDKDTAAIWEKRAKTLGGRQIQDAKTLGMTVSASQN